MNSVDLKRVLVDTVTNVFEEAAYALVEEDTEPFTDEMPVIESLVEFTGNYAGTIALEVEAAGASSIANDLLGNDAPAISAETNAEAIGELANIVAGRLLEAWLREETNYDIGIPTVAFKLHAQTRLRNEPQICCARLRTDAGIRLAAAVLLGRWG